jgi:hypothetical protein
MKLSKTRQNRLLVLGFWFLVETNDQKPTTNNRPGGGERVRTDDLRLAKPALSQLSYTPTTYNAWLLVLDVSSGAKSEA